MTIMTIRNRKSNQIKAQNKKTKQRRMYDIVNEVCTPPPSLTGLPALVKKVFLSASAISYAPSTELKTV